MNLISTRGRYALRVMIDLAQHSKGEYIPMKDVATRQGISLKYLEQILPALTKNNLVDTVHGKGGGYKLTREPKDYTVGEILRLTDGEFMTVSCLASDSDPCSMARECSSVKFWKGLSDTVNQYMDSVTLADML